MSTMASARRWSAVRVSPVLVVAAHVLMAVVTISAPSAARCSTTSAM
jgi:hypothetical protein